MLQFSQNKILRANLYIGHVECCMESGKEIFSHVHFIFRRNIETNIKNYYLHISIN